jgi:hypothetical protein
VPRAMSDSHAIVRRALSVYYLRRRDGFDQHKVVAASNTKLK